MSWVTDVLVICSFGECTTPDEYTGKDLPAPLEALNEWLMENDHGRLVRLDNYARGGGKAFQAVMAASAFNHFPIDDFLAAVFSLDWNEPDSVQVLTKDEEESVFTVHTPGDE